MPKTKMMPSHFPCPDHDGSMVPDVRWVHGRLWQVIGGTPEAPTLVPYEPYEPRASLAVRMAPLIIGLIVALILKQALHTPDE